MSAMDLEREVIRMGDVGVAIDMVDSNLADGKLEQAERAVVILRENLQCPQQRAAELLLRR